MYIVEAINPFTRKVVYHTTANESNLEETVASVKAHVEWYKQTTDTSCKFTGFVTHIVPVHYEKEPFKHTHPYLTKV